MNSFRFGEVVRVEIPFTDGSGQKQRPAVVVSSPRYNRERLELLVMPVTSQLRHRDTYGTLVIQEWQPAGLSKPSAIKPLVVPVLKTRIHLRLGHLLRLDKDALHERLEEIFSEEL